MRVQLALVALASLVVACSTEYAATGEAATAVDGASPPQAVPDSGNKVRDAGPGLDAARPSRDAAVFDAGSPAQGPTDAGSDDEQDASDEPEPLDAALPIHCFTNAGCPAAEFCDFAGDPTCGANDAGGVCKPLAASCATGDAGAPVAVCGCDKHSYASACAANGAGVSVLRTGLCTVAECQGTGGEVLYSLTPAPQPCKAGQQTWSLGATIFPVTCCLSP